MAMPAYLHPGVYVEEIPSGSRPIETVGTSNALFLGFAAKGPVNEPTMIFGWDAYVRIFGGITDITHNNLADPMGHSVAAFFQNGGGKAYIVRMVTGATTSNGYFAVTQNGQVKNLIQINASSPGSWASGLKVTIGQVDANHPALGLQLKVFAAGVDTTKVPPLENYRGLSTDESSANYIIPKVNNASSLIQLSMVELATLKKGVSVSRDKMADVKFSKLAGKDLDMAVNGTDVTVTFAAGVIDATPKADIVKAINDQVRAAGNGPELKDFTAWVDPVTDKLILQTGAAGDTSSVVVTKAADDAGKWLTLGDGIGQESNGSAVGNQLAASASPVTLSTAVNGSGPTSTTPYQTQLDAFLKIRDVNMICLPGQYYDSGKKAIVDVAIDHAEKMRNCMVVVDPPPGNELVTEGDVATLTLPSSTYTALYYPWVSVVNPLYDPEQNPNVDPMSLVPPSGFAAGMWAKTDGRRGVWKAPAGVETALLGVGEFEYKVENGEQDQLNPNGVNAFRTMPGYGPVIWGTRTLATKASPEWRYVPVRRTAMMIEESIYNGIQWAVFEPNDHRLWSSLRLNIAAFMDGLFRAGAFQGETANEAYFVRCGLGDTMTQADIDRGQVIVTVGFAPEKPAEFVIVRIQQIVAQQ